MKSDALNTQVVVPREKLDNYKKVKKGFQVAKKAVDIVGGIATVALVLCPMDGPFGEIATLISTGVLHGMVSSAEQIYDKAVDSTKEGANIIGNATDIARNLKNEKESLVKLKNSLIAGKQDVNISKGKSK